MNQPMTLALRAGAATLDRYLDVVNKKWRHLHPVVITHPVSDRKALYVSPTYVAHIEGVPAAESAILLTFLYAHCQQIEFMFRHRWTVGDMVICDNRSVLNWRCCAASCTAKATPTISPAISRYARTTARISPIPGN